MLSERELQELIEEHLSWPGPAWMAAGKGRDLAHAIAERLAEGVVWEGGAVIGHAHPQAWYTSFYLDDHAGHIIIPERRILSDGQRVRVYVVKEERDGS